MLLAAAAGVLDPALALVVRTHAALCPACGEAMRRYEMIGGALIDAMPPADLDEGALDRLFAAIDAEDSAAVALPGAPIRVPTDPELEALPEPVRGMALSALGKRGWSSPLPGIRTLMLDEAPAPDAAPVSAELIRLEPGAASPRHTHADMEYTLVMTGAFRDHTGVYGPGDLAIGSPDLEHRPVAEPGAVCIALAVTTGPVRFTGALGLIQRALGGG